ncbi:MAG TPA: hypothetical protein VMZ92_06825 [Planctomycetota bacterium]|nr:hypothetical protein [Planctomycetota bacterium]
MKAVSGLVVAVVLAAVFPSAAALAAPREEGDGLAAKYPNDRGIAGDRDVLLHDDFEGPDLKRWDENQHAAGTGIYRGKTHVHSGKQSVQMTAEVPASTGGGLIKWFNPGPDRMYARFYVKFAPDVNFVHHFVHIVGGRDKWSGFGKAGLRPNGTDFFTTGIEPAARGRQFPPPGVWHFYTYWPDMKGSAGRYWGNDFSPEKPIPIPRDEWVCVEFMLQCNRAPRADGEQAFWINGKLAGRYTGFRWRTTNDLKINAFWLLYYVTPEALRRYGDGRVNGRYTVWFDDVVVATKYIGPMKTRGSSSGSRPGGKFSPPPGWE